MANSEENKGNKEATNFARYTGIAVQMLATIGVFSLVGYQIDRYRNAEKPIFTALLGLLGTVFSLYQVVRALNKNK